jgi:hypothetical protein
LFTKTIRNKQHDNKPYNFFSVVSLSCPKTITQLKALCHVKNTTKRQNKNEILDSATKFMKEFQARKRLAGNPKYGIPL